MRVWANFTGRPNALGQHRGEEQLGIPDDLRSEPAADIGGDHPTVGLGDVEPRGQVVAQVVGRLERRPQGQPVAPPVGEAGHRLDRHGGAALVDEVQVGAAVAALQLALEVVDHRHDSGDVRTMGREQHRRSGRGRRGDRRHRRERLVHDDDGVGCVGGDVAVLGDHDGQRLTDEAHEVAGQRRPFEVGHPAGQRRVVGEVGGREHGEHAFECAGPRARRSTRSGRGPRSTPRTWRTCSAPAPGRRRTCPCPTAGAGLPCAARALRRGSRWPSFHGVPGHAGRRTGSVRWLI